MMTRKMQFLFPGAIILLIGLSFSACTRHEERRYELKGKVVNVDKRGHLVSIAHEEIKGYMEPMTMAYRLRDKDQWYLDVLEPGDQVQATLVVAGSKSWLEDLVVSQERQEDRPTPKKVSEPNIGDEIPDFPLVNQDGKRISIREYRGRALVLTFIYTRCPLPDYCPLMTNNFAVLQKALKENPALQNRVHLLSITVDPEYDKPAVLRQYGLQHNGGQGFDTWEFATGSDPEVKNIATHLGLYYATENNQIVHNLQTVLISPDGKLLKIYRGNDWQPEEVLSELQKLNFS
jgi:protein SCO1/2